MVMWGRLLVATPWSIFVLTEIARCCVYTHRYSAWQGSQKKLEQCWDASSRMHNSTAATALHPRISSLSGHAPSPQVLPAMVCDARGLLKRAWRGLHARGRAYERGSGRGKAAPVCSAKASTSSHYCRGPWGGPYPAKGLDGATLVDGALLCCRDGCLRACRHGSYSKALMQPMTVGHNFAAALPQHGGCRVESFLHYFGGSSLRLEWHDEKPRSFRQNERSTKEHRRRHGGRRKNDQIFAIQSEASSSVETQSESQPKNCESH